MTSVKKLFSLNLIKGFAMLMLASISFVACNKDDDDDNNAGASAVEGLYVGKYGFDNDTPDTDYKLKFKPGGVMEEIGVNSGQTIGSGTWQLNGNTITGTYTMLFTPFSKYSVTGAYNSSTHKLVGTWGYDNSATDGGKLEMTRQ
jgi:hypothetical protein